MQGSQSFRRRTAVFSAALFLLTVVSLPGARKTTSSAGNEQRAQSIPTAARRMQVEQAYAKLPLRFEPNVGQADPSVRYVSRGPGYALSLGDDHAEILVSRGGKRSQVKVKLEGSVRPSGIRAADPLQGTTNYFIGSDPQRWRTGIRSFGRVEYTGVYPGVDVIYYGNQQRLEYDFRVAPGSDPNSIRLTFDGASSVKVDASGDLILETAAGSLKQHKPLVYQEINGRKTELAASYKVGAGNTVLFAIGNYDKTKTLVIDPILVYSTFLGSGGLDVAYGVAVDSTGAAYVTGATGYGSFATTNGVFQGNNGGESDVFVTKLNASGNALVYSTYIGGSSDDVGAAIALDSSKNAYITGNTISTNFPTQNPIFTYAGGRDAFVLKLGANGDVLNYSTYFGGSSEDRAASIAVDATGAAIIGGSTFSNNIPLNSPVVGSFAGGNTDGFVARINPAGSALEFSTYLGGSGNDAVTGVAVDSSNSPYATGYTTSTNFPLQAAIQGANGGGYDGFITKFAPPGNSLTYSTYLGGSADDRANGIAVDSTGAAYVGGWTYSSNFPTVSSFSSALSGSYDAFVTKVNPAGNGWAFSTLLGGSSEDYISSITVDSNNQPSVTGYSSSPNFPIVASSLALSNGRTGGVFVTRFNATGSSLSYSTYLGGSIPDQGHSIAVDSNRNVYVVGSTVAFDFPVLSAVQNIHLGLQDGFVSKLTEGSPISTTVTTNPTGLQVTVDGITAPAPRVMGFAPNTSHSIAAISPQFADAQQTGFTRYVFQNWSNNGTQTQTITAGTGDATFTANYKTQHQLTVASFPNSGGTITTAPALGDGYFDSGATVQVTATPATGYSFTGFSGALSGTTATQSLVMSGPRNVSAVFSCAFTLSANSATIDGLGGNGSFTVTTGAGCTYQAVTDSPFVTIVSGANGQGSTTITYSVAANPTTSSRTATITIPLINSSVVYTITQGPQPPASITFNSVPSGRQILLDGSAITTPQSVQLVPGSTHNLSVASPQSVSGTRYTFTVWSDGGAPTHQITAPATGNVVITANFDTAYQLTTQVTPNGSGTIALTPPSADGYYAAGANVQVQAAPALGATFSGFTGGLTGTTNPQTIAMTSAKTVGATFVPQTCGANYTLTPQSIISEATGGTFTVNVTSGAGCFWAATLSGAFIDPFVTIASPNSGAGTGSFQFTVAANTGEFPRTASINVAGQLVQILQHAPNPVQIYSDLPVTHTFFDYGTLMTRNEVYSGCGQGSYCVNDVTTRGKMAELVIKAKLGDSFTFPSTPYFVDVPSTHAQFKYIQKMRELGITAGCTTTEYCPSLPVTRGQMAVFLVRGKLAVVLPTEFVFNATPYFTDVPANDQFFAYIQKMKDLGITVGCTTTSYCSTDPNTLGQISVFVIRAFRTP